MRHVERQIDNAAVFAQVLSADDILRTEPPSASFNQRVQRRMLPASRTLDLNRAHLDATPNQEIDFHLRSRPRMEQQVVPSGDKSSCQACVTEFAFLN